ncbi:MAG: hypothetical protein H6Q69_130 [Firmicutes bacterium]|nr:hypothetical protein [Bacillota bacterium]MBP2657098.1 hypothetical protein [Bacillota bacterium]
MKFYKRKVGIFTLLIAVVLLCLPIENVYASAYQGSEVRQQEMSLLNNSPYHVTALFVCPANSEEWQEVLGGTELRCGKQRNVVLNLDNSVRKWDIKVVDSSGNFTVFQSMQIRQEFTSIAYYYKDGSGRIKFAVG